LEAKMKIDKAIEILTTFTFASKTIPRNDVNDAIRLGIFALKRVEKTRHYKHDLTQVLLPGETLE